MEVTNLLFYSNILKKYKLKRYTSSDKATYFNLVCSDKYEEYRDISYLFEVNSRRTPLINIREVILRNLEEFFDLFCNREEIINITNHYKIELFFRLLLGTSNDRNLYEKEFLDFHSFEYFNMESFRVFLNHYSNLDYDDYDGNSLFVNDFLKSRFDVNDIEKLSEITSELSCIDDYMIDGTTLKDSVYPLNRFFRNPNPNEKNIYNKQNIYKIISEKLNRDINDIMEIHSHTKSSYFYFLEDNYSETQHVFDNMLGLVNYMYQESPMFNVFAYYMLHMLVPYLFEDDFFILKKELLRNPIKKRVSEDIRKELSTNVLYKDFISLNEQINNSDLFVDDTQIEFLKDLLTALDSMMYVRGNGDIFGFIEKYEL